MIINEIFLKYMLFFHEINNFQLNFKALVRHEKIIFGG